MIVLRLDNIAFSHPGGLALENLAWPIQQGEKLGLVGPNGAGKSTILRLLTNDLSPDEGHIFLAKDVTIGYLPQEVILDEGRTLLAEALTASPRRPRGIAR